MEKQIEVLAAQMGVSVGDLEGFLAALAVWMAKGYSLEAAIEKHMAQMHRIANHAIPLAEALSRSPIFVGSFYDDLRAA